MASTNTNPTTQPKPAPTNDPTTSTLDTELQLVSALAKLQNLESTIHHLRTLHPTRLLAPLAPIVQPRKGERNLPPSPQVLYQQLSHSARTCVNELEQFRAVWRGPEMKAVWGHVEASIKELGGQLLQPTGVWEADYGVLLDGLVKEANGREDEERMAEEEREKDGFRSAGADWRGVVDGFVKRDVPGVRVVASQGEAALTVALVKAGMVVLVNTGSVEGDDVPDWRVASKVSPGRPITKLETAMVDCLNSRSRKWDLAYLLEMISSYSEIKTMPCKKCNKMTDAAAQLPHLRRPIPAISPDGQRTTTFEPVHSRCI